MPHRGRAQEALRASLAEFCPRPIAAKRICSSIRMPLICYVKVECVRTAIGCSSIVHSPMVYASTCAPCRFLRSAAVSSPLHAALWPPDVSISLLVSALAATRAIPISSTHSADFPMVFVSSRVHRHAELPGIGSGQIAADRPDARARTVSAQCGGIADASIFGVR